jgi:predicted NACHT family NTPase
MARSIAASQEGIERIKAALSCSQEKFAQKLNISPATLKKVLRAKPIDRAIFCKICGEVQIDWREVVQPSDIADEIEESIDTLVQSTRSRLHDDVKKRCGWMKVLNMTYPIESSAIYTDVNLLGKPLHLRSFRELERSLPEFAAENFDRFWLGQALRDQRRDGIETVRDTNLLMILGAPGAGKSTFLKRLAMLCYGEEVIHFQTLVPLFVTLKEFAEAEGQPNLLNYLASLGNAVVDAETIATLLNHDRGLVLLDGLDEVLERDRDRVIDQIRAFADTYDRNHIVITCRIAAREYTFTRFTDVEIASFSDEQIADFAHKWFCAKEDEETAADFLGALNERQPIKELATNPLLLTLLCLEFEIDRAFPSSRAELYERGLEVLFTRWDTSRKIKREEVYKKLPVKRKKELLGQLGYAMFDRGEYLFKQRLAEEQISGYIANLPDAKTDPEALLVDSFAVLKSIESQHGLLTERASRIYSFSHLTFQEYFTAQQIVQVHSLQDPQGAIDRLLGHLHEPRWREVFFLVVEQLPNADYLLQQMKQRIDRLMSEDKLQQLLKWVQQKSESVEAPYKPAAVRDFYLACALILALARAFTLDLELELKLTLELECELNRVLDRELALALDRVLECELTLALALAFALDRDRDFERELELELALDRVLALKLDDELKRKIQQLRDELPDTSWRKQGQFKKWWKSNSERWVEQLQEVAIEHRNIGHDWQFTDEQKQQLTQYYEANKFLVECLNSECYVSRSVREEIEATLLLPIA